ncbi:DEAD/DEAH box helicase [Caldibacillus lycopersici]|uniref:DEAD/DEAH box helicase n=1 Tax=Perspicuibacillus lycopersici TaxID=1325689 RepID=A0AAE3IWC4_9BACI|nr:DEAD/DEAH box helicase [Perspicuibacillus lycopersici]MCU9614599.1 DEAD/DEAH box helicase [Perspicuibacillus lycopersici]
MANSLQLETMKPYIQSVWKESGFQAPTNIQDQAIPAILEGKDVICESPTGTGKTLAYLLPVIEKLDESKKSVQVVILAPSRELVMQILDQVRKWTKGTTIGSASFIGGANVKKQVEKLKEKPQIVVGTTGRIVELIKMKKLKMHEVHTVVVDEADQLVSPEHLGNVQSIIKATLRDRQVLFFSATISPQTETIAKGFMQDPQVIRVEENIDQTNTNHIYFVCEQRDKIDLLRKIIHTISGRTIAFLKTVEKVEEAEAKLAYHGIPLAVLAGESKKMERQQSMKNFRSGKIPLLLTTDVAARGLDIEDVTYVIHFDFPKTTTQYLHRSGRTGRMGKEGTVISLVNAREESFLKKMSHELGLTFTEKQLYQGKIVDIVGQKNSIKK